MQAWDDAAPTSPGAACLPRKVARSGGAERAAGFALWNLGNAGAAPNKTRAAAAAAAQRPFSTLSGPPGAACVLRAACVL